jgi:hypothetical protein
LACLATDLEDDKASARSHVCVFAVGQFSFGVFALGQFAFGLVASAGMFGFGGLMAVGMFH